MRSMWSIAGNCGYGALDPTRGTGLDIAALSDAMSEFQGSCGKCFEVQCNNTSFKDGLGNDLKRDNACKDDSQVSSFSLSGSFSQSSSYFLSIKDFPPIVMQSIVVTITDACPCVYPGNAYSNKRWCCGDMPHLDLSSWAFDKLASRSHGVIGIKYREVPCDHVPANPAPAPEVAPGRPEAAAYPQTNCGGPQAHQCDGKPQIAQIESFQDSGDDRNKGASPPASPSPSAGAADAPTSR